MLKLILPLITLGSVFALALSPPAKIKVLIDRKSVV